MQTQYTEYSSLDGIILAILQGALENLQLRRVRLLGGPVASLDQDPVTAVTDDVMRARQTLALRIWRHAEHSRRLKA